MNKLIVPLALAAGLTLGLAAPQAHADTIQSLSLANMSASQFNSLFTPVDGAPTMSSPFTYLGQTDPSGNVVSEVFKGTGAAAGLYAYAYQYDLNATPSSASTVNLQATSMTFNATPVGSDLTNTGSTQYGYVIGDGPVGGIGAPTAAPGQGILSPTVYWQPSTANGSLLTTYFDPTKQITALNAGAHSATYVILSTQPFTKTNVAILGSTPINPGSQVTTSYAATGGSIDPIPAPEPTTVLAWAGMVGAVGLVRRVRRKNQPAVA